MRPRKPLDVHELQGTRPKYGSDDDQSTAFAGGKPKRPKDLTPEAEAEWKRLVKELSKRGTLTKVDSSALEIYVVMWARWKKVAALADANPVTEVTWKDSDGNMHSKVVEHPASKQAARLETNLRAMLQQFSATPASREKTKPTAQAPAKNAPPHPDSCAGVGQELDRLRVLQAAQPPEPEPEAEIDVNAIKIPEEL